MAAVIPQTILCEFARYYPAGSSVEAATAPSRFDVAGNVGGQHSTTKLDNVKRKLKLKNKVIYLKISAV